MDDQLDAILAKARQRPDVPQALMDRVLADAYAQQPARQTSTPTRPAGWRTWLAAQVSALGGLPALSGLGTAAVIGVALGYANPSSADWVAQGLSVGWAAQSDLLSADTLFLTEG